MRQVSECENFLTLTRNSCSTRTESVTCLRLSFSFFQAGISLHRNTVPGKGQVLSYQEALAIATGPVPF